MYQTGNQLARRAFLGMVLSGRDAPPKPDRPGVRVARIVEGGAAAHAGARAGDVLLAIARDRGRPVEPIRDVRQLEAFARSVRAGDLVVFEVARDGSTLRLEADAPPFPIEEVAGGRVELGHVEVGGAKLRTIATIPNTPGPYSAILYLQGLRGRSCEFPLDPQDPVRLLVHGWTGAGFLVFRLERSGVGDSEGPACAETDLVWELDGYAAALDALCARPDVDRSRVFLFGESLGGFVAPLVAERPVAGIAVFGAAAMRWCDCVAVTTRRQRHLAGVSGERLEADVALHVELHRRVCREGHTPRTAFERFPHLRAVRSRDCDDDTLFGRHASLFQQLDAIDLEAAWRDVARAGIDVLVLSGQYDWAVSPQDAESLVAAAGAQHETLARIGHDCLAHDTLEASFARPGEGRWDGRVLQAAVDWMTGRTAFRR
jgi:pimeloyl-ACP methyl ester carboxylesterase